MSIADIIVLAKAGGSVLALALLAFFYALQKKWVELGGAVDRERVQWKDALQQQKDWAVQMKQERDDYKDQVESRQNIVDQAIEIANTLKEVRRERFRNK
jgi:hypothetical protein